MCYENLSWKLSLPLLARPVGSMLTAVIFAFLMLCRLASSGRVLSNLEFEPDCIPIIGPLRRPC